MHYPKKMRVHPANNTARTGQFPSKQNLNNPTNTEKTKSSKRKYIIGSVLGGICVCGLFAAAVVVPLMYSLHASQTVTMTTTTISNNVITCGNNATLITFDTLIPSGTVPIPNGYNSINWANAYIYSTTANISGYYTSTISPPNTMFSGFGNSVSMTSANGCLMTLYSLFVAAAWYDNLQLTIVGYNSNVVIVTNTYTLQVFTVSYLTFTGYTGLDNITFITFGGTKNPAVIGSGTQFGMDNIYLSFI